MRRKIVLQWRVAAAGVILFCPLRAADAPTGDSADAAARADETNNARVSLEDATAIVRQAYGGRIVRRARVANIAGENEPPKSGFRFRIDVQGRVKTILVDSTGRTRERTAHRPRRPRHPARLYRRSTEPPAAKDDAPAGR